MTLPILLKNQKILLIGGGKVALQKAKVLKNNSIDFQLIAKEISKDIKKLNIKYILKEFKIKFFK